MGIKKYVKQHPGSILKKVLFAVLLLCMVLPPVSPYDGSAYAISVTTPKECDYNFYSANDIVRYDPCAAVCAPSGSVDGITVKDSKETAEAVFKYLISTPLSTNGNKPVTAVQAAGFLGNMQVESGVDPSIIQSGKDFNESIALNPGYGGYAFGLVQWDTGRRVELVKYAKSVSKQWTDLETQLNFMKKELEGSEVGILKDSIFKNTSSSPAEVAHRIAIKYERPANPDNKKRQTFATAFYDEFKSLAPGAVAFGSGGRCSFAAGNGDIAETAITLSWPKRVADEYKKNKPEYQAALEQTGVSKLGDSCSMGGNSCDAFVATVMRYSGADPKFPCCGANNQRLYMVAHPEKYQALGRITSTKDLKPGDIMEGRSSSYGDHIKIYIGDGRQADASHCKRTASISDQTYFDADYYAFRSTSTSSGADTT